MPELNEPPSADELQPLLALTDSFSIGDTEHTKEHSPSVSQFRSVVTSAWFWRTMVMTVVTGMVTQFQSFHNALMNNMSSAMTDWLTVELQYDQSTVDNVFWPLLSSGVLVSSAFGCGATFLADRFGRRASFIWMAVQTLMAGIAMAVAKPTKSLALIIIGRYLVGFATGYGSMVCTLMIVEAPPTRWRGFYNSISITAFSLGDLIGMVIGSPSVLGSSRLWPWAMAAPTLACAIIGLPLLWWAHESPRYLYLCTDKPESKTVAAVKFYQGDAHVHSTMTDLAHESRTHATTVSWTQLYTVKNYRRATFMIVMLSVGRFISGFFVLLVYSSSIFRAFGVSLSQATLWSTLAAVLQVMAMIPGAYIVEFVGRRSTILLGFAMALTTNMVIIVCDYGQVRNDISSYLVVIAGVTHMSLFIPVEAAIDTIMGELVPQGPRAKILAVSNFVANGVGGLLTFAHPVLAANASVSTMLVITTAISAPFTVYYWFCVPETANRTFVDIFGKEDSDLDDRS